ncbi:MAG: efflux RND transporter periplasmic adaptor subunit [Planctomycetales bacterium]|nr:efflux RND transporter periplasmic adaptor subunit [Planctomycetales bacterium]
MPFLHAQESRLNRISVPLAVFFAGVLALLGCSPSPAPSPPPPAAVRVAHPLQREVVEWYEFTGRLESVHFVEVRSRVSGYLDSVHFIEGETVEEEQLLFVIDPRPFQAELDKAHAAFEEAKARVEQSNSQRAQALADRETATAQLNFAKTEFERQESLQSRIATSQSEIDQAHNEYLKAQASMEAANAGIALATAAIATAQAAVASSQATIKEAELNLEYTNIKAPITGRISRRYVTEGNLIGGGSEQSTLLTTIVSLDPMYFLFDASEQQVLRFRRLVQEGARRSARDVRYPVHLALADETGFPHPGHLDFVDNRFDPNTATMTARATFANPDDMLTPGMFGKVQMASTAPYPALLLPDAAIGADQSQQFVYVLDEANVAHRKSIQSGPLNLGLRIIRSGIQASDRVVVGGLQRIRPGATVAPTMEDIVADDSPGNRYESLPTEKK